MTTKAPEAVVDVRHHINKMESRLASASFTGQIDPIVMRELSVYVSDIGVSVERAAAVLADEMGKVIAMHEEHKSRPERPRGIGVVLLNACMSLLRMAQPIVMHHGDENLSSRMDTLLWLDQDDPKQRDIEVDLMLAILRERKRQIKKWGPQDIHGDDVDLRVTMEEFGEVAKAMNEHDEKAITEEIIHTAACCLAWLERRRAKGLA